MRGAPSVYADGMDVTAVFQALGVSLGLGLIVGLQRERVYVRIAGIRTFALITLLGTISGLLAPTVGGWVVGAALLGVVAAVAIANVERMRTGDMGSGITTEVAVLVMFLVGVMLAMERWAFQVAVAVGGGTAVLLHSKPILHAFVARLGEKDVRAIMQFALITLVILPVLPDQTYGASPWNALNPHQVWLMVVLVVAIGLGGYVAYKLLGERTGAVLAGVLGGLVSSTATTVSYARKAADPASPREIADVAAVVIMLATTVMYGRIIVLLAVTSPRLVSAGMLPLAIMFGVSLGLSVMLWVSSRDADGSLPGPENPSQLRFALLFGATYAAVLLGVTAAQHLFETRGTYAVAAFSGVIHVDAITLSTARLVQDAGLNPAVGWRAVLLATLSNLLFKGAAAGIITGGRLLRRLAMPIAVSLLAGAVVIWLM